MDTPTDIMTESRIIVLGLSPADFREFLLEKGYCTDSAMAASPSLVSLLMMKENIWQEYEQLAWTRYKAKLSDERDKLRAEGAI